MTRKIWTTIFERLAENNPQPTTELHYKSDFELLISVILSAQATDISVNKATGLLFKTANTPEGILSLGEEKLKTFIKTIGLYNTKAKNIIKTCHILIEEHSNSIPKTREALESLPGVGRKTANVVLNTAFNHPVIAVDTHVFRVANRIGLSHGKTPIEVERQLYKTVPTKFLLNAHHWLILHGRYTCVAKKPRCYACAIHDLCQNRPRIT